MSMPRHSFQPEALRLLSLSQQLPVPEMTGPLAGLCGTPEQIPGRLPSMCRFMLDAIRKRVLSGGPTNADQRFATATEVIVALEDLMQCEMRAFNSDIELFRNRTRATVLEVPAQIESATRLSVASLTFSPGDATGAESAALKLKRSLQLNIAAAAKLKAKAIQLDVFEQLSRSSASLFAFAKTADQLLSTPFLHQAEHLKALNEISLLVLLRSRRDLYEKTRLSDPKGYLFGTAVGSLARILARRALNAIDSLIEQQISFRVCDERLAEMTAGQALETFRRQAFAAVQDLLRDEKGHQALELACEVDRLIAASFDEIKVMIDTWFIDAEQAFSRICGQPLEERRMLASAEFEITAILHASTTQAASK